MLAAREASAPIVPAEPAGAGNGLDAAWRAPETRRRLSGPALRTFLAIADLWSLSEEQRRLVLGYPPRSTFHNWMKLARTLEPVTLDIDVLLRLSALFGIHQALGVLYATPAEQRAWLTSPHQAPAFGGQSPIALVTSGTQDGLLLVRRFLDAARGGLYMPPNAADVAAPPLGDADIVFA